MPMGIDIAHSKKASNPRPTVQYVISNENVRGKKSIHMATWGKSEKVDKNASKMKGAGKDHKNPASKPDQTYRLLKTLTNAFVKAPNFWSIPFFEFSLVNSFT